jgi:two-component system, chemotaxis family, protein-glutamate methylesterase/glutaminase
MIRVLVVEDSPSVCDFLVAALRRDPEIEVVATASSGEEAIEAVERNRPDIITMDVHMPKMNGLDATRRIMETHPTPIVIVSSVGDATSKANAFRAMEAGALAVLQTPFGPGHPEHRRTMAELIQTVKLMSEVRVVKRWSRTRTQETSPEVPSRETRLGATGPAHARIVAIGASTGGPPVIHTILSGLSKDFPVPIVVVQHMAAGFTQAFVEWLAQTLSIPIELAQQGEILSPGKVYIAPEGAQMGIASTGQIRLNLDEPENGLRPSVSYLFRSVAKVYGPSAVGILLTGMGKDGAAELRSMKEQGALTIAQDRDSSVVHGMPGEAIRLGAATHVLSPEKIRTVLAGIGISWDARRRPILGDIGYA